MAYRSTGRFHRARQSFFSRRAPGDRIHCGMPVGFVRDRAGWFQPLSAGNPMEQDRGRKSVCIATECRGARKCGSNLDRWRSNRHGGNGRTGTAAKISLAALIPRAVFAWSSCRNKNGPAVSRVGNLALQIFPTRCIVSTGSKYSLMGKGNDRGGKFKKTGFGQRHQKTAHLF